MEGENLNPKTVYFKEEPGANNDEHNTYPGNSITTTRFVKLANSTTSRAYSLHKNFDFC